MVNFTCMRPPEWDILSNVDNTFTQDKERWASQYGCVGGDIYLTLFCIHPTQKLSTGNMTNEKIARLYDMGCEPERRAWVDRYISFMEERGTPVPNLPSVGKKPLDLCRLYLCVREIGGLAMVSSSFGFCESAAVCSCWGFKGAEL